MLGLQPIIAAILFDPLNLDGSRLWLVVPLCASIALVYKTTKVRELRDVPLAALLLFVTIIGGMAVVVTGLYLLIAIFIR